MLSLPSKKPIMQCFVYKSLKKDELYLYIDRKDDFSKLPEPVFKSLSPLQFVLELELTPERRLAREDAGKVIDSLETKGFFVQMPPVLVPGSDKVQ